MNKLQKALALVLCAAMCLCGGGMAAVRSAPAPAATERTGTYSAEGETVYVLTDAQGEVDKIYVTDGDKMQPDGKTDELPVALRVSYTLDGKSIAAQKLAGRSGHVTLRFDYEVLARKTVETDAGARASRCPLLCSPG